MSGHDRITCGWCRRERSRLLAHIGELGRRACPIESGSLISESDDIGLPGEPDESE